MLIFTIRRLINSIFVLLAASFLVYMFAASQYDPLQRLRQQPGRTAQEMQQLINNQRHLLGLDKPLIQRYWDWLTHLIRFDSAFPWLRFNFGKDVNNASVSAALGTRLEVTMRMIVFHLGIPKAKPASRRSCGTSLSISSVDRTTTGSISRTRASDTASALC